MADSESTTPLPISRRNLLVGAGAAVPAGAALDAALLDLGREHARLLTVTETDESLSDAERSVLSGRMYEIEKTIAQASPSTAAGIVAKLRVGWRWSVETKDELLGGPTEDTGREARLIWSLIEDLERLAAPVLHPDADLLALGDELDRAWTREQEAGRVGPDEAYDAAHEASAAIVKRIIEAPASTMDGLKVKARAYLWCGHEPGEKPEDQGDSVTTDMEVTQSIFDDLLASLPANIRALANQRLDPPPAS